MIRTVINLVKLAMGRGLFWFCPYRIAPVSRSMLSTALASICGCRDKPVLTGWAAMVGGERGGRDSSGFGVAKLLTARRLIRVASMVGF